MPRRSRAAFHSSCPCSAASTMIDSSICSAGRMPRATSHWSIAPLVTETTTSVTSASGPSIRCIRTRRSIVKGSPWSAARTASLCGSHRPR